MSALVDRAIEQAGLSSVLGERTRGVVVSEHDPRLVQGDLLAVGALADRIRREECTDVVRVHLAEAPEDAKAVEVAMRDLPDGTRGLAFLRDVAIARIVHPAGTKIRIDFSRCGMELMQIALGFGANEIVGKVANRRGLPIADDATKKVKGEGMVSVQQLKKQELLGLLERSGFRVEFS